MSNKKNNEFFFLVLASIILVVTAIYFSISPHTTVNEVIGKGRFVSLVILVGAYYIFFFVKQTTRKNKAKHKSKNAKKYDR